MEYFDLKSDPSKIFLSFNSDFSKYSIKRDNVLKDVCTKHKINFFTSDNDFTLVPFAQLIKSDGNGFKQFGAFYKNAIKHVVSRPVRSKYNSYLDYQIKTKSEYDIDRLDTFYQFNDNLAQNGGRVNAYKRLRKLDKFKSYNELRDRLDYQTTNLSAYLNFGCISCREVYHLTKVALGKSSQILKQLYWRDFYLQALKYLPHGNEYHHMDQRYEQIKWSNQSIAEKYWKILLDSKTGFLIIDAAIQELKTTGFMHNRARMIVGVFWTKFLLINIFDPKYGSQVGFSKYLVDAIGPSQNKMNHQWITEFDYPGKKYAPSSAPIAGRPMDPSNRMMTKFDPDCVYVKKWLPHLANIPNKDLIKWSEPIASKYNNIHPSPIFDYKQKYAEWIESCTI
jgi:deoxyribodipyrimidine photo-lyase